MGIRFCLDAPASWTNLGRLVIVRGWCFGSKGRSVKGVRMILPRIVVHGAVGLPRPDVKAALPEAPDDFTGFVIHLPMPRGKTAFDLQAGDADGHWVSLVRGQAVSSRWRAPLWLNGRNCSELVTYQMPANPVHPPRAVRPERFPRFGRAARQPPQFTIITPSFNHARFLADAISSVLRQKGVVADYSVRDAASTDNTVEVLRRTESTLATRAHAPGSGGRVRFSWNCGADKGQADAVMLGFAKAKGRPDDLMAWLNSDGHRVVVDEDSHEIGRWFLPRHDPEVLRLNDFVPQETLFWRRRIWDKVGGLDTSLQFALDWDLLLRFQDAGARIVRLPYFLAAFRVHPAQKTNALIRTVGQREIARLPTRANGREIPQAELEQDPRLLRYLRRSARIELLWRFGIRA
jgi:hypothetical protein